MTIALRTENIRNGPEFDVNIIKLGKVSDIFGFYNYLDEIGILSGTSVLLESIDPESRDPLYSFIGTSADFIVKITGDRLSYIDITDRGGQLVELFDIYARRIDKDIDGSVPDNEKFDDRVIYNLAALDLLKSHFPSAGSAFPDLFPRNIFSGGLVGYIGYDIVAPMIGYKPGTPEDFPDVLMGCFTRVLVYSHFSGSLYLISNSPYMETGGGGGRFPFGYGEDRRAAEELKEAVRRFVERRHSRKSVYPELKDNPGPLNAIPNTSEEEWNKMIERTRDYTFNGDIIQAVISRKVRMRSDADPVDVYGALRRYNPGPYMFLLRFDSFGCEKISLIGSSPEPLITKNGRHLKTVPIAGTRRRGRTSEDEKKMEYELTHDPKERAEHIMLVDLARNDLAKVSEPGTVKVTELMVPKKFPNVMHLVSTVESIGRANTFDILKSVFPAGTVSGAPKIRAMEIIAELEKENRGPYAGVVGYFSFYGDMDFAIAIRTLFARRNTYISQAGAGIVADSEPYYEYIETRNKMFGIMHAVSAAEAIGNR